ncbi:NAD(P)-dependent oxidoreductase [Brachyspira pilosicoli]|uniref:NAD(P)-dependent oxidoreductase n=1 Tax=Brachyspira pilosicoli TaxID=52584 RepID=UPI0030076AD0
MKVIAYAVREDEIELFNKWGKHFDIEVQLVHNNLNEDNVKMAEGYDSIIFLAEDTMNKNVLDSIKNMNINYIVSRSVGVDNVDFDHANKLGIKVANVPWYSPNSVSEYALMSTLSLLRNYSLYIKRVQVQDFRIKGLIAKEIRNQVVGIVGAGRIGSLTVQHFAGFNAKDILIYDSFQREELKKYGRYVSMDEIYKECDIIVYHVPLNKETEYMICKENINKMKDGVMIVNVSRGKVMKTADVIEALKSGKISAAAIDVYENELPYFRFDRRETFIEDSMLRELLSMPNVVVTPHAAFYTDEAASNMVSVSLENAREFYDKKSCKNTVN